MANFGTAQTTRWAPGRVNLIGEHTDYNEGFVLPIAIDAGCRATVRSDSDTTSLSFGSAQQPRRVRIELADLRPGAPWTTDRELAWAAYPAGVMWAIQHEGTNIGGISIEVDSDVPPGAGLSSSAALACSVAAAVGTQLGLDLTPADIVALARRAENDFVGAPTGGMDQLASVNGVAGHALLCDMRTLAVTPVPFAPERAGLVLLVVDTKAPHQHSTGAYRERRDSCFRAAELLGVPALRDVSIDDLAATLKKLPNDVIRKRVRHVVTEDDRVLRVAQLLELGKLADIGPILTESHASMRDDYEITVAEIDLCVEVLLAHGAVGSRMTGGGFGGSVIALIRDEFVDAACVEVRRAFAEQGFSMPVFRIDSAGPGVVRAAV